MIVMKHMRMWMAFAMLVWSVGLVLAGAAWFRLDRDRTLWHARQIELDDLYALGDQIAQFEILRNQYREYANSAPHETLDIIRESFPDALPEIRRSHLNLDAGWIRQDIELNVTNVSVARLVRFVNAVERTHVPLRLTRFEMHSSADAGQGDARLVFVRLLPHE